MPLVPELMYKGWLYNIIYPLNVIIWYKSRVWCARKATIKPLLGFYDNDADGEYTARILKRCRKESVA